jgi:ABC-type nitrate/sulfonate/bicarbonate transport system substrate-binding protein
MNSRWPFFLFLAAAIVAPGLLWQYFAAERPLDRVGAVSIAASLTFSAAPVWLAQDRGLFARAGLDVTLQPSDTGKTATEAMLSGAVDLAPATEYKAIESSFARKDLRILGTTAFVHNTKLLGLKSRGISRLADIKGKRVGVNLGTSGEYHLARLLMLNGMTRGDITWVNLKPQAMAAALLAGQVDAVQVWAPFPDQIKAQLPDQLVEFDGQPGEDFYYVMLGRQEWLAGHGKVAERVMLALKWAEEWLAAHPEEARAWMASKFGVQPAQISEEMKNSRFFVGLPQNLLSVMEAERDWLVEQGIQGTPLANTLDLIDFAPLSSVAPAAVTMVRGSNASH